MWEFKWGRSKMRKVRKVQKVYGWCILLGGHKNFLCFEWNEKLINHPHFSQYLKCGWSIPIPLILDKNPTNSIPPLVRSYLPSFYENTIIFQKYLKYGRCFSIPLNFNKIPQFKKIKMFWKIQMVVKWTG